MTGRWNVWNNSKPHLSLSAYDQFQQQLEDEKQNVQRRLPMTSSVAIWNASSAAEMTVDSYSVLLEELRALTEDAESGSAPLKDVMKRLDEVEKEIARADRLRQEFRNALASLDIVDKDRIAWVDENIYSKYPSLRPHFDF